MTELRLGVSACLFGQPVRYDGSAKESAAVTERFAPHVTWVPICPEVEQGMPIPRPPIRLEQHPEQIKLIEYKDSGTDFMDVMTEFSASRAKALAGEGLSGYVFKATSPSCGPGDAGLFTPEGDRIENRDGVFAAAVRAAIPNLPMVCEEDLESAAGRENFLARCEAYESLQHAREGRLLLTEFHRRWWIFFHAHSASSGEALGELAEAQQVDAYAEIFFRETTTPPSREDHQRALEWAQFELTPVTTPHTRFRMTGVVGEYAKGQMTLRTAVETLRDRAAESQLVSYTQDAYLWPSAARLVEYEAL